MLWNLGKCKLPNVDNNVCRYNDPRIGCKSKIGKDCIHNSKHPRWNDKTI